MQLEDALSDLLKQVRAWLEDKGGIASITHGYRDPSPYSWGGTKHPECVLWAGTYNHLDLGAMLRHLEALSWASPEFVQLFVKEQEESTFCVYMFRDGHLVQVLPYVP